ncbi:MAG: hypothetical protein GX660_01530, partial [Clostridiaceae bacterium]|nr:hypothetical protein [Clostridiaceae bacterium]
SSDSAREAGEDDENIQTGDIEHINWCVFHNDNRITGINAVPLSIDEGGKRTYAGFDEVRKYVQQMRQKGIPAETFDGIDKYLSYISAHHLITAEWNIIKGINSGENSIESYFRQNPTSRKLIENHFVRIIEDIEALNKGERNNDESLLLADTLIEIRSRLNEYLRLKGHMSEYEKVKEYYHEFGNRNEDLLNGFTGYEACKSQAVGVRNLIDSSLKQLEIAKTEAMEKREYNSSSCREGTLLCRLLEAGVVNYDIRLLADEKEKMEYEANCLKKEQEELERKYNELMTLESYGEYRKRKERLFEYENSLCVLEKDKDELNNQYRTAGGRLRYLLDLNLNNGNIEAEKLKKTLTRLEEEKRTIREALIKEEKSEAQKASEINSLEKKDTELNKEVTDLQEAFIKCGEMNVVMDPKGLYNSVLEQRIVLEDTQIKLSERVEEIDVTTQELELNIENIKGEIRLLEEKKKMDEEWLKVYQKEFAEFESKASGLGRGSIEEYQEELELRIHKEGFGKLEQEIEAGRLKQKKQLSGKRGCYVPNEEIINFSEQLSRKCEYVKAGIDWISETDTEMRKAILEEMPFLPFSVIVDGKSFEKLKGGKVKLDFESDYPIPVVNLDTIRGRRDPAKGDMYYFCSFKELLLEDARFNKYMEHIDAEIEGLNREIEVADKRLEALNMDFLKLNAFLENYSKEKVDSAHLRVQNTNNEIEKYINQLTCKKEEKARLKDEKAAAGSRLKELMKSLEGLGAKLEKLEKLIKLQEELTDVRKDLSIFKKQHEALKDAIKKIKVQEESLENQIDRIRDEIEGFSFRLHDLRKEREGLDSFTGIENNESLEEVRSEYKAVKDAVAGKVANESDLRRNIEDSKTRIKEIKNKVFRDYGGDLESISESEKAGKLILIPTEDSILKGKSDKAAVVIKIKDAEASITKLSVDISKAEGKLGEILKNVPEEKKAEIPSFENKSVYEEEIRYTRQ